MKLKKIPRKKKFKLFILIIILYTVFAYTFYYSFRNNKDITNEEFIKYLLNNGNIHFAYEYKLPNLINSTLKYLLKIDLTKPVTLFNDSILGYTENEIDSNEDLDKLKAISSYITDPFKKDISNPIIYIYNSHQLENYNSSGVDMYGITPNVQTLNEAAYQCAYDLSNDWTIDTPTWDMIQEAYKMGAEDGMEYIRRKINGK